MKDRIIKFMTHENLTATRFADEIGVQRSSISHILSGRNNPSFEFIQKMLGRYKQLNAEWLLVGTGSMLKKNDQSESIPPKPAETKPVFTSPSLFQESFAVSSPAEGDKNPQAIITPEIKPSRQIEKILVFYSDKTFDEFFLSK
jgi:transcriptional regulator with XRE-family HTH domain